jgi:hypothetical protein
MAKKENFTEIKIEDYNITPCDVIFSHVTKPKDYLYCKSINVFDDRWRVNIYSKRYVEGIEGKYISQSYFIHFDKSNGNVKLVSLKD